MMRPASVGDAVVLEAVKYNGATRRCQLHQGRKRNEFPGRRGATPFRGKRALTPVPETAYNRGLFADPAGSAFARAPGQAWGTR